MANPSIVVDFVANTKDLQAGFRQAQGHADGFGSKLKGLAKGGALAAGAAGIGALTATMKIGIDEFSEASKVSAQTEAALKSTGGAAGTTAKHIGTLAEKLMKKSGVDDEAIQSGENLLLTFTNIRNEAGKGNDVFDQTTKAALDMSTALGTDMKSASMQLGKALNDPEKGITKLTRSGVTFTEEQKKQIKALQESGDTLGAQKIILGEVNKEFGGSAAAAGKTLPGQINILKESFSNLAGALVAKLVPVIQSTITWLRDHWPEISAAFNAMWNTVKPIVEGLWQLLKAIVGVIVDNWPLIEPVLAAVATNIKNAAKIIGDVIQIVVDLLHGDWAKAWQDAKKLVTDIINALVGYLRGIANTFGAAAIAIGRAILQGIQQGISGLLGWIGDQLTSVKNAIVGAASAAFSAALGVGKKIFNGFIDGVTGLYTEIRNRVMGAVNAVDDFLGSAGSKALSVGRAIYHGLIDGVTGIYTEISSRVSGAVNAVDNFIGAAGAKARAVGRAIYDGIVDGIGDLVGKVRGMVDGVIGAVKAQLRGFHVGPIKIKGHTIIPRTYPFAALAAGGIVTRPTMALIGEAGPEAVIPLSGSSSPAVQVRVFIGDQELTSLVRTQIVESNTGLARTLLAG